MNDAFELEICQGKYRYRHEAGKQEVWRNGEPWEVMNDTLIGNKFVFSLAVELDEAIKERDALRAKIERMDEAMESLLIRCDDSDSAMYGTLSTSFVRDTVRIARGALEESK